jgi:DNA (cytosine-5)-methyltransferase 1
MKYLSVCSGIEAASVAWHPLGWSPIAFAEIEKFPSAVLTHNYPSVPNFGDMTKFKDWPDANIDVFVGGTPCQSFSVAGLRQGLADPRGNLCLTFLAIADKYRPEWLLWENVPGVLSSDGGRDFGAFLGGLGQLGYGWSYRVLDAQYVRVDGFGRAVPQRRRRVFVVGNSRDWRRAAAVLFERESLSGNIAPRREAGERVAPTISARPSGGGGLGTDFDLDGGFIAAGASPPLTGNPYGDHEAREDLLVAHSLRVECFDARQSDVIQHGDKTGPLDTDGHTMAIQSGWVVRRLTPRECERLQGFPDGYTDIPWRGKNWTPDGPRYKALGNSMAVNCMRWLGRRIQMVSEIEG